jgi:hypothetical protein
MALRYVHIREEDLSVCSKVAHLKEGEVRIRRDSSLYPRDLDLVSAGPRAWYVGPLVMLVLLKALAKLAGNRPV